MQNHYLVLGVSREADREKIKKAYRRVAKQYHPDVTQNRESAKRFLEIKEAYETLSDETKRRQYDAELERERSPLRVINVPDIIQARTTRMERMENLFSSSVDEFLEGFLPGFFDVSPRRIGEKDLYLEAILSPDEAATGGLYPVTVPVWEPCPRCGRSGFLDRFFCPLCHGYGRVWTEREFSLNIPPRVRHGTEVRVSLEGIGLHNIYVTVVVYIATDMKNVP
ncbi:MAG: DnaJ domain-containing protein [Deltaproteobacteria bacterium]|nr:DnaJ domain-containing protein [Deltaproteobacteria bacterium]